MTNSQPVCRRAETREDIAACLAIREAVFIDEQAVDPGHERDGLDDACIHYLCEIGGRPAGTARARILDDRIKIQRVAVLKDLRGKGIGEALMRFMMADLAKDDNAAGRFFFLSSQCNAIPFYERLGFEACSDEFMEAGIAHRDMRAAIGAG